MSQPVRRRATYQDVLDAPPNQVAEILFGVLHANPRPAIPHAGAASSLGGELHGPFQRGKGGPGGWLLLDEPELHLHEDVVVPDLAGWRRERMPRVPATAAIELPPDWVCEVISPRTQSIDRGDKMDVYAREVIPHLWFVDPLARTLEAYRLEAQRWVRLGTWRDEARVRAEPFDALELELAALWVAETDSLRM
jgi:Uma2 family endonuclease